MSDTPMASDRVGGENLCVPGQRKARGLLCDRGSGQMLNRSLFEQRRRGLASIRQ